MPTKTIDVTKSDIKLAELLPEFLEDTEIILTQDDVPFARLVPVSSEQKQPRVPGLHPGALKMHSGFDEPLSDKYWLGEL